MLPRWATQAERARRARPPLFAPHPLEFREETVALRAFLAGLGLAELLEQLLLPRRHFGRRLDIDLDHQIAATAPVEHGHARAALADLLA